MAPRFAHLNFNLMRAIELFEDMNHDDMDVTAPSSDEAFTKEQQVADRLDDCLTQLIEEGLFNDCDPREDHRDEQSGRSSREDSLPSTPRSEGFEIEAASSSSRDDDEDIGDEQRSPRRSFTDRFKRYVKRMLSGSGKRRGQQGHPSEAVSESNLSLSYDHDDGRSDSLDDHEAPYDPSPLDNEHRHGHDIHDHHHRESSRSLAGQDADSAELSSDQVEDDDEPVDSSSRSGGRRRSVSRSGSVRSRSSRSGRRSSSTSRSRSGSGGGRRRDSQRSLRASSSSRRSSRSGSRGSR